MYKSHTDICCFMKMKMIDIEYNAYYVHWKTVIKNKSLIS